MVNKRGWIRILEATIAVLIVSSVLVVVYTKQSEKGFDAGEYIYNIQRGILNEISLNETLRNEVLISDQINTSQIISDFVRLNVPLVYGSRILVCDLTSPPTPCKLNSTDFIETQNFDIFVSETVISSNLTSYSPKKVKLFVWEKR